MKIFHR